MPANGGEAAQIMAILVVFSGLPGVGKTTIARSLSQIMMAVLLRVDTIEQAIRIAGTGDVGPAGYDVANALAAENLRLGRHVVADSVNPVAASRQGWRATAARSEASLAEIRVICSDEAEHHRRLSERVDDLPSIRWQDVLRMGEEPWDGAPHLLVDAAMMSAAEAVRRCRRYVEERS